MSAHPSLTNRNVIVTGGSRGLGRVMAIALLNAGARVAIVSRGPSAPLDETERRAKVIAPPTHWLSAFADLQQRGECDRVVAQVRSTFGSVDVLINNAAIPMNGPGKAFWEIAPEDWLQMSRVNCDSVFLMSRAVVPAMIERGFGRIVNISTGYSTMVRNTFSPYGPTKAFVETCTRVWANELRDSGVTVNALLPGGAVDTAADVTGVPRHNPLFVAADVMAEPILWLASDESGQHTGERFLADRWRLDLELPARIAAARESGVVTPSIM